MFSMIPIFTTVYCSLSGVIVVKEGGYFVIIFTSIYIFVLTFCRELYRAKHSVSNSEVLYDNSDIQNSNPLPTSALKYRNPLEVACDFSPRESKMTPPAIVQIGIIVIDPSLRIVSANTYARDIFHHNMVGEACDLFFPPTMISALTRVFSSNKSFEGKMKILTDISSNYLVLVEPRAGNQDCNFTVVVIDIAHLEHTDVVLLDFITNMSHEVRTPMTSIIGATSIIKMHECDTRVLQDMIPLLLDGVNRIENITNELFFFIRLERHFERKRNTINFMELVNNAISDAQKRIGVAFDEIVILDKKEESFSIYGHYSELKCMLYQILKNSLLYSTKRRRTLISYSKTESKQRSIAKIEVSDNGIGIPNSVINRITEPLYRYDESRAKVIPGSGIGLYMVKKIVEKYKGKLKVKSLLGVGTTITNTTANLH